MQVVQRTALVPFAAEKMFGLVDDIASYPAFLPWCKSSDIHHIVGDETKASIEMAKAGVHKSFTTRNISKKNHLIEMYLVDGPFKHLYGAWKFDSLNGNACKVSLNIEFEFANKILSAAVGPVFNQICNSLVDAFVKRAREIYG